MQFVRLEVERRVAALAVPMFFSGDETCDVGKGTGSAVSPDYDARDNEFSGEVNWVQIDLEKGRQARPRTELADPRSAAIHVSEVVASAGRATCTGLSL
jgi:hypothetical protein